MKILKLVRILIFGLTLTGSAVKIVSYLKIVKIKKTGTVAASARKKKIK
jgi:hypothetical protein